ncbi:ACT domain-containing protein [Rhodopirellula sp. SWK7]|uniref:ACT domain-containing protein n=1 Tax=Rhodopirellula sp. SWK7 TaxID=595460 RepID=UPI0002BE5679|nr:ACT domain-containing protein [Rhodopirellula sp. SWK7]EMI41040.1 hypothetical protein RRSWK_06438 [Rhodopirellula sp. SWK7]
MNGISNLSGLLASLSPDTYVFLTRPAAVYGDGAEFEPIAAFAEREGSYAYRA